MSTRIQASREVFTGISLEVGVKSDGLVGGDSSEHAVFLDASQGTFNFSASPTGDRLNIGAMGDMELVALAQAFEFLAQALRLACPSEGCRFDPTAQGDCAGGAE